MRRRAWWWALGLAAALLGGCSVFSPADTVVVRTTVPRVTTSTAPPVEPELSRYEVVAGDTLIAIASRFGVSLNALAAANNIADPTFITVGQVLIIPEPGEHVDPQLSLPPPTNPDLPEVLPTLGPVTTLLLEPNR